MLIALKGCRVLVHLIDSTRLNEKRLLRGILADADERGFKLTEVTEERSLKSGESEPRGDMVINNNSLAFVAVEVDLFSEAG